MTPIAVSGATFFVPSAGVIASLATGALTCGGRSGDPPPDEVHPAVTSSAAAMMLASVSLVRPFRIPDASRA
ncbi:hypothetical protein GCM10009733_022130 [Nonomuraea maheshkhaliensis]|uniref:Uncharacterized protein n=1 Tax=Nonomuraea maheshkhaliensis TaxID=419590 RepID=A0ABN2F224_9ACTN